MHGDDWCALSDYGLQDVAYDAFAELETAGWNRSTYMDALSAATPETVRAAILAAVAAEFGAAPLKQHTGVNQ